MKQLLHIIYDDGIISKLSTVYVSKYDHMFYKMICSSIAKVRQVNSMAQAIQEVALNTVEGSSLGAANGFQVAVMSSSSNGEALSRELVGIGLSDSNLESADLEHAINETMNAFGRIGAVVNNCLHTPNGDLLDIFDEDWHKCVDVVLMTVFRLARNVVPIVRKHDVDMLVNISTFSAFELSLGSPTSSAIRCALGRWSKLFSDCYAIDNLRISNVLPGFIESLPKKQERV